MWVRIPLETYIFILNFSLPPRSEQVNGAVANEIKHVHSPEVIVVLDPRYDLSYKALYISTCIERQVGKRGVSSSILAYITGLTVQEVYSGYAYLRNWENELVDRAYFKCVCVGGGGRVGGMTVTKNKDVCCDYAFSHTSSHPEEPKKKPHNEIGDRTRVLRG